MGFDTVFVSGEGASTTLHLVDHALDETEGDVTLDLTDVEWTSGRSSVSNASWVQAESARRSVRLQGVPDRRKMLGSATRKVVTDPTRRSGLHHTVDFFGSEAELGRLMAESAKQGVDRSESVLVAAPEGQENRIRSLLGTAADSVHFEPADNTYARPSTAMYGLVTFLTEQLRSGHTRMRSIGAASITPEDLPEWIRYEACINEVLTAAPLTGVCFYDSRALTDRHRSTVEQTHPHLGGTAAGTASENYLEPHRVLENFPAMKLHPDRQPDLILHHVTEARPVRMAAAALAPPGRDTETRTVVHELTALALKTGPGSPQVRMWREPHSLVVRVIGSPVFDDPFAGWRPPQAEGNAALWIARQLADDFSVDPSGPDPAATVVFSDPG